MSNVVCRPPCVEAVEIKTPAQNPEGGRTNLWREAPHEFAIRGPQRTISGPQDTNGESPIELSAQ